MAVASEIAIYNLALNAVGARGNISSPNENSREAEVCKLWFSPVRDQILASAIWPEATAMRALARLGEADDSWDVADPRQGYMYSYALPSDLLRPQYLSDFSRFLITGNAANQGVLNSSNGAPVLIYTRRLEAVTSWNAELQMAVVYALAAHICMPLSGKPSRAKMLIAQANELVLAARESAANSSTETFDHVPDWIAARGYNSGQSTSRFIYPTGSLLSISA